MLLYALMVLVCGTPGDCVQKPYHDMTFTSKIDCETAIAFLQKVRTPDAAPNLTCEEVGRKI